MNQEEFEQGCKGFCNAKGACHFVGKWLERNFTPKDCDMRSFEGRGGKPSCIVDLTNPGVTTVMQPRVEKEIRRKVDYKSIAVGTKITIECTPDMIIMDMPVPKDEARYWERKVDELAEGIETLYRGATHFHTYCDHVHIVYRDPTYSGFAKLSDLITQARSSERPELSDEDRKPLETEHIATWE